MPKYQSAHIPPVVTWSLLVSGAWLIYASVRGLQPLAELRASLTGAPSPGGHGLGIGSPSVGVPSEATTPATGSSATPGGTTTDSRQASTTGAPTDLTKIGQGGHQLSKPTADRFAAWQKAFGASIIVTDSYRDYATQLAAWKSDPVRFAPPDKSRHVKGQAVDVNLQAVGASPTGTAMQKATWKRLYDTAIALGWCNPRGPYNGDHAEPWHFSYPGCG
jgi:hypothetical protein